MTQDEIIEMAKQSGLLDMDYELGDWEIHEFTTFAKLVAAKEREEIAEFIDSTELGSLPEATAMVYARLLKSYSTAIRARGEAWTS